MPAGCRYESPRVGTSVWEMALQAAVEKEVAMTVVREVVGTEVGRMVAR